MQFFVNGAPVCGDVLPLGVQGEALTTTVTADVSDWLEQWPGGQVIVQVISPGQTQTRIANTVVQEGVLTWLVTSEDTVTPGFGAGVVKLIQGQQVKKSAPFITQVVGEPNDESSAQETVPGWVDEAIRQMQQLELDTDLSAQAAQAAQTAAEAARDAAQTAQTAAETASGSASESAQTAQTAAAAAGESADAAQTYKTAAETAAQAAGTAAEAASGSAQQAQTAAAAAGAAAQSAQTAQTAAEAAQADATASAAQAAQAATDAQTAAESAQQAVAGAVKYSEAQTLTAAQQAQARENIGAASGDAPAAPPIIASAGPADIVSVTDGAENALVKKLTVQIEPVQAGSGDPSPDNVRPISGWTAAEITRCAENLLPPLAKFETVTKSGITVTANADGSYSFTGTCTANNLTFDLDYGSSATFSTNLVLRDTFQLPPGVYTFAVERTGSFETSGVSIIYGIYPGERLAHAGNGRIVMEAGVLQTTATFDTPVYVTIVSPTMVRDDVVDATFRVSISHSASNATHALYNGATYPVTLPAEAGTVYGGTLTINGDGSGELVVDRAGIASYSGESLPGEWISDRDVYAPGATPTTGAQVVYYLATPVTYSLTAPQVRTLLGANNIWADAGPVSVEYTADTKMYIDSQTRATRSLITGIETDLTASRPYATGDLLIVGDTLYKAAASIASGATLTPGTNVTPTTVAEQLILLANA